MKRLLVYVLILYVIPVVGQQSITLETCYDLVATNYPLAKQPTLLEGQNKLDKEVVKSSALPQLNLDAQATYQSDVIEIPIPSVNIDPLNKDQYRATLSVNQLIYQGGSVDASLLVKSAELKTKQKQVEVNLYQLKKQVNQLYFSILLAQETKALLKSKQALLATKIQEVQSGIKYGVLLPASDKVLEAELLKIDQQLIETNNNRLVLIETLSSLMGHTLEAETNFVTPIVDTRLDGVLNRPELELFQYKKEEIESTQSFIAKQNMPKLFGFATGGYGNPGLNTLDNSFQTFYMLGIKLNWNVFDWKSNKNQRKSLAVNKDLIDTETELFRLNTHIELNQQQKEMETIESAMISDRDIIQLRKEVLKVADSQLKNGVITASAYITEFTNLFEDENNLARHSIQLKLTKANYNIIQGQ